MKQTSKLSPLALSIACATSALLSPSAFAEQSDQLDKINVSDTQTQGGERSQHQLKDSIEHTNVVSEKKIEKKQAANLSEAIKDEPGVRVSTECSMCGVKRVMLNGLKGEHTTLMTNGVANSSIVEGFYGFDAIPMAGITAIEISRGAGASLIAPEAIGGVINVVTDKPKEDKLKVDLSRGTQNYHKYQFVGTEVSEDQKTALSLSAQSDNLNQYDQDNNDVNESPALTNQSFSAQMWHQLTDQDHIDVRIEDQSSEIFGGPMTDSSLAGSRSEARSQTPGDALFEGNNINNRPTSGTTARDFLENIESKKQAYTVKWRRDVNPDLQTQLTASYVDSEMDALYEPTTYQAEQDILFVDARAHYFLNDEHALTFGIDFKEDKMRSQGTSFDGSQYVDEPPKDAYDFTNTAAYVRDIWTPAANLEISAALRFDQIDVEFVEQDGGNDFNETLVAPRLHVRYDHDFNWTSRFSAGQGYRVPLQFFEADHGILDDGFAVDVAKLEKSNSLRYALAYEGAETLFETSYSWTAVDNLAFIDTEHSSGVPTLVNSEETGSVQHADMTVSHQLNGHWSIGAGLEGFFYDQNYRNTFGVIPVEERLKLMADYSGHGWEANLTVTGIGERRYADYEGAGYESHYDQAGGIGSKGDSSPAYFTADMRLSKDVTQNWNVYAGVNNLFDYTQTGESDSPLFFDGETAGAGDWDVGHIWGPLRGRMVYAGVKGTF